MKQIKGFIEIANCEQTPVLIGVAHITSVQTLTDYKGRKYVKIEWRAAMVDSVSTYMSFATVKELIANATI